MTITLTSEQVYLLKDLIYEEIDRVNGILNLPLELMDLLALVASESALEA